jgi:hypothetical protein
MQRKTLIRSQRPRRPYGSLPSLAPVTSAAHPPTLRLAVIGVPLGPIPPVLPEARPPRNASAPFTVYCEWHGIMATQATRKLSELNIDKVQLCPLTAPPVGLTCC